MARNTAFPPFFLTASTDSVSTAPTTSTEFLESSTGKDLQAINAVSTGCLQRSTHEERVKEATLMDDSAPESWRSPTAALNPLTTTSTVSTACMENAESLTGQNFQSVDAVSTGCLQRSTGEHQAAGRDASEFAIGDRVTVKSINTWQPATLLAIPNPHPNPSQRMTAWKARLDTGQEIYVWDIRNICPLNVERGTP